MLNAAIRKQLLMSHESFTPKRWEGKNLKFRFKYLIANYPELAFAAFVGFVIAPIAVTYKVMTYKDGKYEALQKYRSHYTVVRHDDPDVERLKAQKEIGRHFYPE